MAITFEHFSSGSPIHWQWPLNISYSGGWDIVNELNKTRWGQIFTSISDVNYYNEKRLHVNIHLLVIKEVQTLYTTNLYSNSDCLLIIVPDLKSIDHIYIKEKFLSQSNSKGLFIFAIEHYISDWFNLFLIELSHNYNLVEALSRTVNYGHFLYDKNLESQTTLRQVIINVRENLLTEFRSIIKYHSLLNPEEIRYLLKPIDDFEFKYESGEASILAGILKKIQDDVTVKKSTHKNNKFRKKDSDGDWESLRDITTSMKEESMDYQMEEFESIREPDSDQNYKELSLPLDIDEEAPAPVTPTDSGRTVQAIILSEKNETVKNYLLPQSSYSLRIYIGFPSKDSISADEPIDDTIFEESTEMQEKILIVLRTTWNQKMELGEILLPRTGNSSAATFHFSTNNDTVFESEVYAYHKNRLIQKLVLKSAIKGDKNVAASDTISLKVVFCLRKQLSNLSESSHFKTSIFYESDVNQQVTGIAVSDSKPVELNFNRGLEEIINDIKNDIENAVIEIEEHPEDLFHENNQRLLKRLALKGNSIFVNHLRKNKNLRGPIQIISKRAEYTPLDFVYTLPPPGRESTICRQAKEALLDGKCRECYNKGESPAKHICPFGFWAFSEVLERHHFGRDYNGNSDYCIRSEPSQPRNILTILQNTLYASTSRVESSDFPGLRDKILNAIKSNSVQFYEALDWDNWSVLTHQHEPDSLILLVHTEDDEEMNVNQLEIGDKKLLIQNLFDSSKIKSPDSKKAPFIIVIGCETTEVDNYGFDISSQLMNEGAAIVISNFTKIRGRHAGPIVMKLVEYLKQHGKTEISLGEIVLKLRQYLLSEGIMVGLALTALGDADWKIKT